MNGYRFVKGSVILPVCPKQLLFQQAENDCDIREDLGQMATEVKIVCQMSHNALTIVEEYVQ